MPIGIRVIDKISQQSDVSISSPQNGEVLVYDALLSKWKNASMSLGGSVTSVSVTSNNGINSSVSDPTGSVSVTLGLGDITPTSVASSGTVTGSNLSGTNTGDQTITLTGDVTGTGTSSFSTTIGTNVITLAKFQQIATSSILGRTTAGIGNVEVLSASQIRTLLSINNVENTALSTWIGSSSITTLGTITSGTWNGTNISDAYISSSSTWNAKESALTFSTGLTRSVNTITVNTSQNITTLSNLTSNGFVKTSGSNGTLSVDTNTYLTANQTITLSGDVSGSGSTSISTTIGTNVVTLAKFQQIATSSILGRVTASTGNVEVLKGTQATTLLYTFTTSLKGLVPNSGGGTTNFLRADGTWAAPPGGGGGISDGDKGDITVSSSGTVWTIDNSAVTLAKFQDIVTSSILGRVTGSTGNVEVLTGTQATTLLDTFTTSLKGLVPSSGGGTTNFLRADGTWAAPPGGGGGISDGDKGDITVSSSGTVWTIDNNVVSLAKFQQVATNTLLGRSTVSTGNIEVLTIGSGLSLSAGTLTSGNFTNPITLGNNLISIDAGIGSPENIKTAPVGSLYIDSTSTSTNNLIYLKTVGTGNIGWSLLTSIPMTPKINVFGTPGNGNVVFDKGSLYAEDHFNWDSDNGILKISSNVVDSRFSFFDSNSYNSIWSLVCDNGSNLFSIYNHNLTSNAIEVKSSDNSVKINGTLSLVNTLTVSNGGTGASTFGSGQILYGNGTGTLSTNADLVFETNSLRVNNRCLTVGGSTPANQSASSNVGFFVGGSVAGGFQASSVAGFEGYTLSSNRVWNGSAWVASNTGPWWQIANLWGSSANCFNVSRSNSTTANTAGSQITVFLLDGSNRASFSAGSGFTNTTGFTSKLAITNVGGTASDDVILLQGNASQSGDYLDVRTSANANVANIDSIGRLNVVASVNTGYRSTVTAGGTTVFVNSDAQQQFFTGTLNQTITLPVASTMIVGQHFRIVNNGTGTATLTINSSGANLVTTVYASGEVIITCILASGTDAASWDVHYIGSDVQTFLAGGTWTKRPGLKFAEVIVVSGGGGGSGGAKGDNSSARVGGGGGGSGGLSYRKYLASELSATENVTVGVGGNGGAGTSSSPGTGSNGSIGGSSQFGSGNRTCLANVCPNAATGGGAGSGGVGAAVQANLGNWYNPSAIGASANLTGTAGGAAGTTAYLGGWATGGASGGGITTGSVASSGGFCTNSSLGSQFYGFTNNTGGGTSGGGNGTNGPAAGMYFTLGLGGGGGGSSVTISVAGGRGGDGGFPGGGGGGGGAASNTAGDSGAGGAGGSGVVYVICYF